MTSLKTIFIAGLLLACAGWMTADARGNELLSTAEQKAETQLEEALRALGKQRDAIAAERLPLVRDLQEREARVMEKRRELARLQQARDNRDVALNLLKENISAREGQLDYIRSITSDFIRSTDASLHLAEAPLYSAALREADRAARRVDQSESARLLGQLAALELALDRLEARLGGQRFRGEVLNPRGETVEGTVMAWGPSYYFSSLDGEWRGLLLEEVNTALPVLLPLESPRTEGLVAVASGRAGSLPLDPTLGDAVKLESTRLSVLGHIAQGKAIGYVILGLGLITLTVGIFKCVEIVRFPEIAPPVIGNIVDKMQSGDAEGALTEAQRVPGVPGEMLAAGVVHRELGGQVLEEMMFEKILRVRPMLERYLPFIALVAAAAPLLGLLGTVVGMIDTFRLITLFGTGDAAPLAGGIAKALVTTELGLLVAIPALVLHGFLTRLARRKLGLMEQAAVALINGAGLQPDEAKTEDGS